jgi:uncharacterized DUF497 family protein
MGRREKPPQYRQHGIAFEEVLPVFFSQEMLLVEDRRRDYGEARFTLLCHYEGVHLHVTFTRRGEDIRLISARRANKRERRNHERRKHN